MDPIIIVEAQLVPGDGLSGSQRGRQEGLTCRQGLTPEGQEKQQPRPSHDPLKKRPEPAAALRCGLGEEAPSTPSHGASCTSAALPHISLPTSCQASLGRRGVREHRCHSHPRSWVPTQGGWQDLHREPLHVILQQLRFAEEATEPQIECSAQGQAGKAKVDLFIIIDFYFMCVGVLPVYTSVCHVCA